MKQTPIQNPFPETKRNWQIVKQGKMENKMKTTRLVMLVLAAMALPLWGQGPNASFDQVYSAGKMNPPNNTVKLTWVGLQSESVSTVAFAAGALPDLSLFIPYRTPGFFYNNDDAASDWLFSVSDAEMGQVLTSLSQIPTVVAGGVQGDMVSLSVYLTTSDPSNPFVFEVILDSTNASAAVSAVKGALDPNNPGVVYLQYLLGIIKGS